MPNSGLPSHLNPNPRQKGFPLTSRAFFNRSYWKPWAQKIPIFTWHSYEIGSNQPVCRSLHTGYLIFLYRHNLLPCCKGVKLQATIHNLPTIAHRHTARTYSLRHTQKYSCLVVSLQRSASGCISIIAIRHSSGPGCFGTIAPDIAPGVNLQ